LGPLPSTACSSTPTCPRPIPWPSDWPGLIVSQTFTCINTLAISSQLSSCPHDLWRWKSVRKYWHLKFRCWESHKRKNTTVYICVTLCACRPYDTFKFILVSHDAHPHQRTHLSL
jgi:hypothetical protein